MNITKNLGMLLLAVYLILVGIMTLFHVGIPVILSTKNREPWLDSDVRPRMRAYLATICRDLGAELVNVGGVADHVHIVTTLPRTLSQADLIERIKKASSKWIKTLDARYRGFFWQRGYGAFSVSPEPARGRAAVRRGTTRAPSHSHVSGGVSRAAAQAWRRFRRA